MLHLCEFATKLYPFPQIIPDLRFRNANTENRVLKLKYFSRQSQVIHLNSIMFPVNNIVWFFRNIITYFLRDLKHFSYRGVILNRYYCLLRSAVIADFRRLRIFECARIERKDDDILNRLSVFVFSVISKIAV